MYRHITLHRRVTAPSGVAAVTTQVLMEIRRLVVESEAAHPTAHGSSGGVTFSGGSGSGAGASTPRLLKRPDRPTG